MTWFEIWSKFDDDYPITRVVAISKKERTILERNGYEIREERTSSSLGWLLEGLK